MPVGPSPLIHEQVNRPATIGGPTFSFPVNVYQTVESSTKTQPSTMFALGEGAKVFGRIACKTPYVIAMFCFEIPSLFVECITGTAGAAVGAMVGSAAILARKCMGVRARKFFGLENPRTLLDYMVSASDTGSRLGELPGKFVGGITLFTYAGSLVVSSSAMIPLTLIASTVTGSAYGVITYVNIKRHGECSLVNASIDFIQSFRTWFQMRHDDQQGMQRSARDTWA